MNVDTLALLLETFEELRPAVTTLPPGPPKLDARPCSDVIGSSIPSLSSSSSSHTRRRCSNGRAAH